ncbi:MAG: hypothetical protein AAFU57_18410 [Bacteroidota bacterium]
MANKSITYQIRDYVKFSDEQLKEELRLKSLRLESFDLYDIKYRSLKDLKFIFLELELIANEIADRKGVQVFTLDQLEGMKSLKTMKALYEKTT